MKISRALLGQKIDKWLKETYADYRGDFISDMSEVFLENGVDSDTINKIFNLELQFEIEPIELLFLITKSIIQVKGTKLGDRNITDLNEYFTEQEIDEMENVSFNNKNKLNVKELYNFNNTLMVNYDQFITVIPVQRLIDMYNYGLIRYNTSSQRDVISRVYKNTIVESININHTQVEEIKEAVLDGQFIPNVITINVLRKQDGGTVKYADGKLNLDGEINILDGFHRSLAYWDAMGVNPDLELNIELRITNFDIDKARKFIVQEDKQRKMDKQHILRLEMNYINQLVDRIKIVSNDFKKALTTTQRGVNVDVYVIESQLREVLSSLFEDDITDIIDFGNLSDQIIPYLDTLYSTLTRKGVKGRLVWSDLIHYLLIFYAMYEQSDEIELNVSNYRKAIENIKISELIEGKYSTQVSIRLISKAKEEYKNKVKALFIEGGVVIDSTIR